MVRDAAFGVCWVVFVEPQSPAATSGLVGAGDVVVKLNAADPSARTTTERAIKNQLADLALTLELTVVDCR